MQPGPESGITGWAGPEERRAQIGRGRTKECFQLMDTEMSDTDGQPNLPPPAGAANPVWKQFAVCGSRFVLPDHYEVIKPIGQGAYGVVW